MDAKSADVHAAFADVLATLGAEKLLELARAHATTHVKLMLPKGVSASSLADAIRAGNEEAWLGLLELLPQVGEEKRALELASAVARCSELQAKSKLMCITLRTLLAHGAEDEYLLAIPLSFNAWWNAQTPLSNSKYPGRATALINYLEKHVALPEVPPWPRLGEPESSLPTGEFLLHAKQVQYVFDVATPGEQARMREFVRRWFQHAPTKRERLYAAQVLRALGETAPLLDRLDDADPLVRAEAFRAALAVDARVYFDRAYGDSESRIVEIACMHALKHDPVELFERLGQTLRPQRELAPEASKRASALLESLYQTRSHEPTWFAREPRWIPALVRIRGEFPACDYKLDSTLSDIPRALLDEYFETSTEPKARKFTGKDNSGAAWLKRYEAGAHAEVWAEIVALGHAFGSETELGHARDVAHALMKRVRQNVWTLSAALQANGFPLPPPKGLAKPNAKPRLPKAILDLRSVGPIPIALEAFYAVVGAIEFVPEDTSEPPLADVPASVDELDPLQVFAASSLAREHKRWQSECEHTHPVLVGPLAVTLALDCYHKADLSGGGNAMLELPDASADPFVSDWDCSFVDYLRRALLERAGMLGSSPEIDAWVAGVLQRTLLEPF